MNYFNKAQFQVYNSIKPIVIGIFGRGKGKTSLGIQKAIDTEGVFITYSGSPKTKLIHNFKYNNIYTSHEFFNLRGVSIKNKTVVIDEIDYMKLSNKQINSILYDPNIKQLIILGTPSSLEAKVQPIEVADETQLQIEFESDLLQLWFNLRNSDRVDCIIASSDCIPEGSKSCLTVDECQCSFLKQV